MVRRGVGASSRAGVPRPALVVSLLAVLCLAPACTGGSPRRDAGVAGLLEDDLAALVAEVRLPGTGIPRANGAPSSPQAPPACEDLLASGMGNMVTWESWVRAGDGSTPSDEKARERWTVFVGAVFRVARLLLDGDLLAGPLQVGVEGARPGREVLDGGRAAVLLVAPVEQEGVLAFRQLLEATAGLPGWPVRRPEWQPTAIEVGGGRTPYLLADVRESRVRVAIGFDYPEEEVRRLFEGRPPERPTTLSLPGEPLDADGTSLAWRLAARPLRAWKFLAGPAAAWETWADVDLVARDLAIGAPGEYRWAAWRVFVEQVLFWLDEVTGAGDASGAELAIRATAKPSGPVGQLLGEHDGSLAPAALAGIPSWTAVARALHVPSIERWSRAVNDPGRTIPRRLLAPPLYPPAEPAFLGRIGPPFTCWWAPRERDGKLRPWGALVASVPDPEALRRAIEEVAGQGVLAREPAPGDAEAWRPIGAFGDQAPGVLVAIDGRSFYYVAGGRPALEAALSPGSGGTPGLEEAWGRLAGDEPVVAARYRDGYVAARLLRRAPRPIMVRLLRPAPGKGAAGVTGRLELARKDLRRACAGDLLDWLAPERRLGVLLRTPDGLRWREETLARPGGLGEDRTGADPAEGSAEAGR